MSYLVNQGLDLGFSGARQVVNGVSSMLHEASSFASSGPEVYTGFVNGLLNNAGQGTDTPSFALDAQGDGFIDFVNDGATWARCPCQRTHSPLSVAQSHVVMWQCQHWLLCCCDITMVVTSSAGWVWCLFVARAPAPSSGPPHTRTLPRSVCCILDAWF